jgi:hypothetical protein
MPYFSVIIADLSRFTWVGITQNDHRGLGEG